MNMENRIDILDKLWKSITIRNEDLVTKFETMEKNIAEHEARLDVIQHYIDQTEEKFERKSKELQEKVIKFDRERVTAYNDDRSNHE